MKNLYLRRSFIAITIIAACLLLNACGDKTAPTPPPVVPVSLTVTATNLTVSVGESITFSAAVANASNTAVVWTITEGAAGGTINSSGLYTAPMKAGTYHVVATSAADSTKSVSVAITVTAPKPIFYSTAPTSANEGDAYVYTVGVTDPANTPITLTLVAGSSNATISGTALSWTPSHNESRTLNTFTVRATTDAGGTDTQTFSVIPTGTIRGTAIATYVESEGTVDRPVDLTSSFIAAVFDDGDGMKTVEAETTADGTFAIPGVPAGNYWLVASNGALLSSANDIDLGADYVGRPNPEFPEEPTFLAINLDGLLPWTSEDEIELFNPNLNQNFEWSDFANEEDTSASTVWPWAGPLSEAEEGDAWYATQMRYLNYSGVEFEHLVRATPALAITQEDGMVTPLDGTLADATDASVNFAIAGEEFASAIAKINPDVQLGSTTFGVYVHPFTGEKGWIGDALTLLQLEDQEPITTAMNLGAVHYGDPFPQSWARFTSTVYNSTVQYLAEEASDPVAVPAEIAVASVTMPTVAAPIRPVIVPVTNIKLNGVAITAEDAPLDSTTPTLSWTAPSTGSATGYRVTVYLLDSMEGTTQYTNLIDLYTTSTSLTIPPGVLYLGQQYFFAVRAINAPGVDFTRAPNRLTFPWAYADALTPAIEIEGGEIAATPLIRRTPQITTKAPMAVQPSTVKSLPRPNHTKRADRTILK